MDSMTCSCSTRPDRWLKVTPSTFVASTSLRASARAIDSGEDVTRRVDEILSLIQNSLLDTD